ncbi:hypothetical protein BO82DRAFT_396126 [Aspergillus uvarum CBS 121591]|uniref:C2H2-type domain-containing protein n=1 Tax=Aspergillus uvarum CBS 121591 TaxID=1448315 RepID=A0A319D8V6_9EURO|nr:hypothetical protein BO82DRAFT_396126 [Aspergillus uvarum CBS 121591]PYH76402.1 hypothetical protein BO82DRAFT_396126 [Aspergillus uvarum CBS 121591]
MSGIVNASTAMRSNAIPHRNLPLGMLKAQSLTLIPCVLIIIPQHDALSLGNSSSKDLQSRQMKQNSFDHFQCTWSGCNKKRDYNAKNLIQHIKFKHIFQDAYQCPDCAWSSHYKGNVKVHILNTHIGNLSPTVLRKPDNNPRKFFNDGYQLFKHISRHVNGRARPRVRREKDLRLSKPSDKQQKCGYRHKEVQTSPHPENNETRRSLPETKLVLAAISQLSSIREQNCIVSVRSYLRSYTMHLEWWEERYVGSSDCEVKQTVVTLLPGYYRKEAGYLHEALENTDDLHIIGEICYINTIYVLALQKVQLFWRIRKISPLEEAKGHKKSESFYLEDK